MIVFGTITVIVFDTVLVIAFRAVTAKSLKHGSLWDSSLVTIPVTAVGVVLHIFVVFVVFVVLLSLMQSSAEFNVTNAVVVTVICSIFLTVDDILCCVTLLL